MKIVFFSNYLNHHQAALADELYKLTGGEYRFVATMSMPDFRKDLGYADYSSRPYLVQTEGNKEAARYAMQLAMECEVAMFCGRQVFKYQKARLRKGLLSFEVSERWFKGRWHNYISPYLWRNQLYYHFVFHSKPFYKLCASAYGANDQYKMHSFIGKCFKWGYFPEVLDDDKCSSLNVGNNANVDEKDKQPVSLLWCGRFLDWKHPELVVQLAERLKRKGYGIKIDMFGNGDCFDKIKSMSHELDVDDIITLKGSVPNAEILNAMKDHDIFLFTSNRAEGWGAVANEAMANGCVLVGAKAIGSVPFLVKHRENGCIFETADIDSLEEEVVWLIENPEERIRLSRNGIDTMQNVWAPHTAANNFLTLIEDIKNNRGTSIMEGPCSQATPI